MPVSLLQAAGVLLSVAVLGVTTWNLYLSHYKEKRSGVEVLPQENDPTAGFGGGSHSIDDSARWTGHFHIKIANTGEKGAYVAIFDHNLKGFRKDGELVDSAGTELEVENYRTNWTGKELEPHSSARYRGSAAIEPEKNIGPFVRNDYAVIEHVLTVEDNQGSYTVTYENELELSGPDQAVENWRKHSQRNA